ncbi:hypothetical protein [uncultured Rikenella sp.]|nr:hypothetical protein [uncultured Rikenella sp.]
MGRYGHEGSVWSSATAGINGVYLGFVVAWFNPSSSYGRSYGIQLRCLSE